MNCAEGLAFEAEKYAGPNDIVMITVMPNGYISAAVGGYRALRATWNDRTEIHKED